MKHILLTLACFFAAISVQAQTSPNIAWQDATVRFTVISDGAVRLEYQQNGQFNDNRSFVAVQREYPKADFRVKETARQVVIETPRLVLTYTKGTGKFTKDNLTITSPRRKGGGKAAKASPRGGLEGASYTFTWNPSIKDTQNLKGTFRTLDGYNGNISRKGQPMEIEDGLLSRSGWTLIDDTDSYLFDNSEWPWITERTAQGETQDWYFLAYGHDYKQALHDFTLFAGKMPLPPRYAFGYWWSRYWHYSDNDFRRHVGNFRRYGLPLDVLVVDIDWHYLGENKGGWTGYTWNRRLFPNPKGFLHWLKDNDLQITLNLHPADGIRHWERHYPEMARWMNINPADSVDIPWDASSKHFMQGWLNTQLKPMEKNGVDFWWLDWQQWSNDKRFPRLSNTWWINYVVFSDMERTRTERPMLYHRWGGLGNHRYQIGFSGDAIISWNSLDFQPYFNSTASNVLYGFWSHDIGGHYGVHHIDPEMYVRWMQFGLYSPILRTHSTKDAGLNKEPWAFNEFYFTQLRDIINRRYQLTPYIYTMARKAHDTGISLCRPMYYDYPDNEEAYTNKNEYMFGDDILVYPITQPMQDSISTMKVWLPAGNRWYEECSGTLLDGGQTVERRFHLDEMPVYYKAGAIIPNYKEVRNLKQNDTPIILTIAPTGADAIGADASKRQTSQTNEFTLYEDNGNDKAYDTEYATTHITSTRDGQRLRITIGARQGSYKDMPTARRYSVKVLATAPPESVSVDGNTQPWHYEGNELALYIDLSEAPLTQQRTVEIVFADDAMDVADGLLGQFRRVQQNVLSLKKQNADIVLTEELGTMESTGRAVSYYPEQFNERVSRFRDNYNNLETVLRNQTLTDNKPRPLTEEAIQTFLRMTR